MKESSLAKLAKRIAQAFKSFHGFIYQRGVDDPKDVLTVVRSSGIGMLLNNVALSQQHGIYALLLNDRACRTECIYEKGCSPDDSECLNRCMEQCRSRIIDRIVEALNSYAERQHRAAKR
ncbi:hypothetical protein [Pyrodictium abyssi]|uniref:Uncharacterized protein n=1 Tax=Pyrodictium abyssi TaxID=54256 RepID=A0ABM8IUW3_9CREN|nr:hypothetical protein PABY_09110 [Pyrodictium abyssi]